MRPYDRLKQKTKSTNMNPFSCLFVCLFLVFSTNQVSKISMERMNTYRQTNEERERKNNRDERQKKTKHMTNQETLYRKTKTKKKKQQQKKKKRE